MNSSYPKRSYLLKYVGVLFVTLKEMSNIVIKSVPSVSRLKCDMFALIMYLGL